MNTPDKGINIAKKEVGYLEKSRDAYVRNPAVIQYKIDGAGHDNYTKYAWFIDKLDWYNGSKQGQPWCSTFIDYCLIQAYGEAEAARMKHHGPYDARVDFAADNYAAMGRFFGQDPKPGDQIFFQDADGDPCHTGLVIDVDDQYVYTIEGNTSPSAGVVPNGGGVHYKKYYLDDPAIYGYGRPLYDEEDYMTRDEILHELGDTYIERFEQLPEWAKPVMRELLDKEIINGGTNASVDPDDINMFLSDIKTIIVNYRLINGTK